MLAFMNRTLRMPVNPKYEVKKLIETRKRSLLKAITWRFIAAIITTAVVFLFTKHAALSISIGTLDTVIKLFSYYLHERIWAKIDFGRGEIEYHI